ncbi:hypothetical protein F442_10766 [Phytophthora nicotianae P10297]|uniref:XPG N-terminal domain-containing protein n=1 Tax=Phytophthora nicotianae P10297 TaxID=1317064 RepID=W2Z7Y5_PHYNI|nr:hypothetical protein F442_10766 [Phytophthora nicotianae P10297]
MGVRGLTRYCRDHEATTSVEKLDLHDVTLAVDFVGFLYYRCEKVFGETNETPSWLLLGGCTLRLERYVDTWLKRLRERRVRLVFVTDPPQCFGGVSHRKGYCLQDRALEKAKKIEQLAQSLEKILSGNSTHESTSTMGLARPSQSVKGESKTFNPEEISSMELGEVVEAFITKGSKDAISMARTIEPPRMPAPSLA